MLPLEFDLYKSLNYSNCCTIGNRELAMLKRAVALTKQNDPSLIEGMRWASFVFRYSLGLPIEGDNAEAKLASLLAKTAEKACPGEDMTVYIGAALLSKFFTSKVSSSKG